MTSPTLKEIIASHTPETYWKHTVLELAELDEKSLRKDVANGIEDLYFIIFNILCEKCGDKYTYEWFDKLVEAVKNDEEIPLYNNHKCMNYYGFHQRFKRILCLMLNRLEQANRENKTFTNHPLMHPAILIKMYKNLSNAQKPS